MSEEQTDSSRRVAIFFDVFFIGHLDMALRQLEDHWQRDRTSVREVGLAEIRALRADLAKQINQQGLDGCFLPPS
jgi:hypothetical protein